MAPGFLSSPIVWVAGGGLGLVLLLTKSPGANAQAGSAVAVANPAYMSASVSMNAAALGAQIQLAQTSADFGKAQLAADVTKQSLFYGYLKNQDDNATVVTGKQIEASAGITNNIIASSAALQIDRMNNDNRLSLAYVDAWKSFHTDDANVNIEKLKADAQKSSAKSNMFGNLFGAISKTAMAFA